MCNELKEFVLSKQVLKSGTSIGVLICEGEFNQSKPDITNKLSIVLKEANKTLYWIKILHDTNYLKSELYENLINDDEELIKLLVASIKTVKGK